MSNHDPEDNEIRALLDIVDFSDKHVLEIGCGDGSKTLQYTERAAYITAIDPDAGQIKLAKRQTPDHLQDYIEFHHTAFEDFAKNCTPAAFDIVILAKSLCWMEYAGMVHALEEIHRLLKSTGRLIDIHPVAISPRVEINEAGKITLAGYLSVHQWFTDFQQADNALTEITQRGLFIVEQEDIFDVPIRYASAAEMQSELMKELDYFARDTQSAVDDAPNIKALVTKAEELMQLSDNTAQLIAHEPTHISRLRPIERGLDENV